MVAGGVAYHDVKDTEHWLASPKREEVFGPLGVTNPRKTNVLFEAFVEAGKQAGHPYTDDFNGPQQEGVGPYQLTIKDGAPAGVST